MMQPIGDDDFDNQLDSTKGMRKMIASRNQIDSKGEMQISDLLDITDQDRDSGDILPNQQFDDDDQDFEEEFGHDRLSDQEEVYDYFLDTQKDEN